MNWRDELSAKLVAKHWGKPQEIARIEAALREIEASLNVLSSLGHPFHLEEQVPGTIREWPRWVYSLAEPQGRQVWTQAELAELGPGWYDHPTHAAEVDGLEKQFAGRGGVQYTALPAVV